MEGRTGADAGSGGAGLPSEGGRHRSPTQPTGGGGDSGEVWNDFGQKVDLTARLREILLNYPEGTSILKELVQNAVRVRARA